MVRSTPTQQDRDTEPQLVRVRGRGLIGKLMAGAVAVVAVAVLIVVLSAVSLLPRLHNPFGETTSVRSQPGAAQVDHGPEPVTRRPAAHSRSW